jgi:hypothetical protein
MQLDCFIQRCHLPKEHSGNLAKPIDICFGSMLVESTTLDACLVIESNAVTSNQQVGTNLLAETHPHCSRPYRGA